MAMPSGAGLDATQGQHTDKKCDYAAYVSGKFYEYVAIVEMIYYLATDEDARKKLMQELSGSALGHATRSLTAYHTGAAHQNNVLFEGILSRFGYGDEKRKAEHQTKAKEYFQVSSDEAKIAIDKFISACAELYEEIKKRFAECGWFYGVATLTTDGLFIVGEALLGAGIGAAAKQALKAIKFAVTHLKEGKTLVKIIHPKFGEIEKTFENKALKSKYGDPEEHHPGTESKDPNRKPGDGDGGDKKKSNKEVGNLAEEQAKRDLIKEGYTETLSLENASGNGIDLIGRNPVTGELKVLEVKGNSSGLSGLQREGGSGYLARQMSLALEGEGSWAKAQGAAETLQKWLEDAPAKGFEIWKYEVDPITGQVSNRRVGNWDWKGKENKPARIRFREDASSKGASDNAKPPSTGPPSSSTPQ